MTEIQLTGLSLLLTAALPYMLALYIEKHKHWSLFSGWDASKISDHDACGRMMCKGIKAFSVIMGLGGAFIFLTGIGGDAIIIMIILFSVVPLMYYILMARKLYWK